MVEEEEGTIVAVDVVMAGRVDAAAYKARTILDRPIQHIKVCVPISAPMFLNMVQSLQQIQCALHGRSLCSMSAPIMGKT
jgi:hypothetical protein